MYNNMECGVGDTCNCMVVDIYVEKAKCVDFVLHLPVLR